MNETSDAVGDRPTTEPPWTIRNMAPADREAAVAAARRAEKTVAEWLGEAVRFYVAAERERSNGASYSGDILLPTAPEGPALPVPLPERPSPIAMASAAQALGQMDALEPQTIAALNRMLRRLSKL